MTFETLPRLEDSIDHDRDHHGQRGVEESIKMYKDREHFLLYVSFINSLSKFNVTLVLSNSMT
jgi:hypothetical protein